MGDGHGHNPHPQTQSQFDTRYIAAALFTGANILKHLHLVNKAALDEVTPSARLIATECSGQTLINPDVAARANQ